MQFLVRADKGRNMTRVYAMVGELSDAKWGGRALSRSDDPTALVMLAARKRLFKVAKSEITEVPA